ncbi:hypothetical protein PENSPDRAFT_683965 [Peniophora sp. CONT]|nr:hypothetical protein PENSPDRAFT_683965 [Peniophora sp. CONT]
MNYSSYRSEPSYYEERSPGGASARTSMALATGMPQNLPSFDIPTAPSDSVLAAAALADEAAHRFPSFRTDDAITLGLSLRKRFRASRRSRTRSMVISITALSGAPLFQCAVGDGVGTEDWGVLGGMIEVVRRTGHCSWYVEKGLQAVGEPERYRVHGGAFPIFLENAPVAPVAVVAAYSGSSEDDHRMVVNGVRDYIRKQHEDAAPTLPPASIPNMSQPATSIPPSSRAQSIAPSSRPQSVAGNRDSGNSFSSAVRESFVV